MDLNPMRDGHQELDNLSHDGRVVLARELAVCWKPEMLFIVTYSMPAISVLFLQVITLLLKSLIASVIILLLKKWWRGRNRSTIKM